MSDKPPPKWEFVSESLDLETSRLPVPGGWLYFVTEYGGPDLLSGDRRRLGATMTFVPLAAYTAAAGRRVMPVHLDADEPFIDQPGRPRGVAMVDVAVLRNLVHLLCAGDRAAAMGLLLATTAQVLIESQRPEHAVRIARDSGPELARMVEQLTTARLRGAKPGGTA